ncbi:MAG: UvrD-helicase domain-containing protein [Saprospirales bacterium]|nr:UvrD-helicase domain-containing protein [Saprospirales bacterium]
MLLKIISAGAGSGKTYRLTSEMVALVAQGIRPEGIVATTFTNKAAAELQERVRVRLLEEGYPEQADRLANALIGTVHSLGVRLLQRFAYEAGVSPQVDIIAEEDQQIFFNQSLATVLTQEWVDRMEDLCDRLGLHKRERYDWRKEVKSLVEVTRANGFGPEQLALSKTRSIESFRPFLGEPLGRTEEQWNQRLEELLSEAIDRLGNNGDSTKKTETARNTLRGLLSEFQLRGRLFWHQWVKISKLDPGVKSRVDLEELMEYAASHDQHTGFHEDIRLFIEGVFDIASMALLEFDQYKKSRGLIDYTDMEVLVARLLDDPEVNRVLREEIELLLVDEFQDTSPIQLEIFMKLSRLADQSIWVGDPKQSIYGFRGAEPRLMQAIVQKTGGIRKENILEFSWRSRQDIVFANNALFSKAFSLPPEQIVLQPKRLKESEPADALPALWHWHFEWEGEDKRQPGGQWMENAIANALHQTLERGIIIQPKGEKSWRKARPGDVAILCRTNRECMEMAEALHRAGLKAALSRAGLLQTAEAKLLLACLKYILNRYDTLSIAEILLLAEPMPIEDIIEDRLKFLRQDEAGRVDYRWAGDYYYIRRLNELREKAAELSGEEMMTLVLEELDLRRIIASWGNPGQRLANVEILQKLALKYEEGCNRLHAAASLGGYLLWLGGLESAEKDLQAFGESPEAVRVITYHRSKGLEYPLVICASLEQKLQGDVWDIKVIPEREEVDLDDVLGHRWLRYWVNPYSDQVKNTRIDQRLDESEARSQARSDAREEEARLLYVGLTRARDYLVFPTASRPTKWLNRVWHEGNEEFPTLDPHIPESPWDWAGKPLDLHSEQFVFPRDFTVREAPAPELFYLASREGRANHPALLIDLRTEKLEGAPGAQAIPAFSCGGPLAFDPSADAYQVAKAFKALLAADSLSLDPALRSAMAQGIADRFDQDGLLSAESLLAQSESFFQALETRFGKPDWSGRKYPLRCLWQDRRFQTVADLIWKTPNGWALVQHSAWSGDPKNGARKALELSDWAFLSRLALEQSLQCENLRVFIHLVLSGEVFELRFPALSNQMKLF